MEFRILPLTVSEVVASACIPFILRAFHEDGTQGTYSYSTAAPVGLGAASRRRRVAGDKRHGACGFYFGDLWKEIQNG